MKVSFLGAGAIGSMFAALLKQHAPDLDVLVVVRGAHGEAISHSGEIEIVGPWGNRPVPIAWSFDPADVAGSDFVFVTVKSQATREALQQAGSALGDAVVVSIQNGINDGQYTGFVPLERLVMGMTATNMAVLEPGQVSMQLDGHTMFGPPIGSTSTVAAQKVVDLMGRIQVPGLDFSVHPNILGVRYNKLVINALGYASCLSGSNFITEALCYTPWREGVGRPIVAECRRVLAAGGVEIPRIQGRSDLTKVENLMRVLGTPILGKLVQMAIRGKFERSPIVFSLLQDLRRGKPTEVDHINGQIVRVAAMAGTEAPVNAEIVKITHELEHRSGERLTTREDVIDRIINITKLTSS
ncbi:ketopantoate reductase family protein [Aeoliella sp. SH292]|uniref:ketopantoate reductase family protein n=1 Tax=Aeoliella sp. SH292 TaxID=3454464 RepID=UPI003F9A34AC